MHRRQDSGRHRSYRSYVFSSPSREQGRQDSGLAKNLSPQRRPRMPIHHAINEGMPPQIWPWEDGSSCQKRFFRPDVHLRRAQPVQWGRRAPNAPSVRHRRPPFQCSRKFICVMTALPRGINGSAENGLVVGAPHSTLGCSTW